MKKTKLKIEIKPFGRPMRHDRKSESRRFEFKATATDAQRLADHLKAENISFAAFVRLALAREEYRSGKKERPPIDQVDIEKSIDRLLKR